MTGRDGARPSRRQVRLPFSGGPCSVRAATRIAVGWLLALTLVGGVPDDIVVADFEGATYGDWTTTGDAFGPGPARGRLPNQMEVSGYQGEGLVNTYYRGDDTTGTLTSPPFRIERRFLTFLIGGGGYEGTTCLELLLDGEVVRTATGPNVEPGGTEQLVRQYWDVEDLAGKQVTLQIVDAQTGGWGHINVDHLVQSDRKPDVPDPPGRFTRDIVLSQTYLLFPIVTGARMARLDLSVNGKNVREFDAELAESADTAEFWAFLDCTSFRGERATLTVNNGTASSVALIKQSDGIPGSAEFYNEALRPQFHFSQKIGWNNDPNGLVYHDGEWHLYFQHNPYGWKWGNMHWGHAVSRDLVHWEQLPIAIYNKQRGDWAFSGGALLDERNTAGWQTGPEKVIVASWTSTGRGECIAYSRDRGRTFTEYEENPVIRHAGRDPKIIWYAPGQHWVMVVYDEYEDGRYIAFYKSTDLKQWVFCSRIPGYYECPEITELPIDGDPNNPRWIIFAADAQYAIGTFDGHVFTPEHEGKHRLHFGSYYASQLFSNTPDGRVIQIGWARIPMPNMPFNQTFTFPHQLTLRSTDEGVRLFAEPVQEITRLHQREHRLESRILAPDRFATVAVAGELFDIRAVFEVGQAAAVGLDIGGERVVYDSGARTLRDAPLTPVDGRVAIQVLVDRPMLEIIGNHGRVYITNARQVHGEVSSIHAFAEGGEARLIDLEVHELNSIWVGKSP